MRVFVAMIDGEVQGCAVVNDYMAESAAAQLSEANGQEVFRIYNIVADGLEDLLSLVRKENQELADVMAEDQEE